MGAAGITTRCLSCSLDLNPNATLSPSQKLAQSSTPLSQRTTARPVDFIVRFPLFAIAYCGASNRPEHHRRAGTPAPSTGALAVASTDPGRRPASGACPAFPRDTDTARLHQLTASSSRLPFSLLPPIRPRYRLPLRQRRHRQCPTGRRKGKQPKRRPNHRSIVDCDRTSTRRVHRRLGRRGDLCPHYLLRDVSVHLGTLVRCDAGSRPRETRGRGATESGTRLL